MAKVKLSIETKRPLKNGEFQVVIRFCVGTSQVCSSTGVTVEKDHWLSKEQRVLAGKKGDPMAFEKNAKLTKIKNDCDIKMMHNSDHVVKLNPKQLRAFLLNWEEEKDEEFFSYSQKMVDKLQSQGRVSSARTLNAARNKIMDYWVIPPLYMSQINVAWLDKFSEWCQSDPKEGEDRKKISTNAVASYMRYLRLVMSDAVKNEVITNYPFVRFKIKTVETVKRNLSIEEVRKIRDYTSPDKRKQIATDMWFLMLCLSGISPKDLFYLPYEALSDGRIRFNRFKTSTRYNIKVEPEAKAIISQYRGEKYLLYFADYCGDEREPSKKARTRKTEWQWKNEHAWGRMINNALEDVQKELKINPNIDLTCYTARHTVGTILRSLNVSIDDIALVYGHKRQERKITMIYTEEDPIRADKAMRKLLNAVKAGTAS